MNYKNYLIVSGIIFGLVTAGQLARLTFQIPVQVGQVNIPIWPSFIGLVVALTLCVWAFKLLRGDSRK